MYEGKEYDLYIPENLENILTEYKNKLLDFVNKRILNDPQVDILIGGRKNIQVMIDNHRNHIAFMSMVIKLRSVKLLSDTLPWVYRAYHNQGFSYEYFKIELKLWKEAIISNISEVDCSPLINIYQMMIDNHEKTIEESKKEIFSPAKIQLSQPQIEFLEALITGKQREVYSLTDDYLSSGKTIAQFYIELIQPVMYEIGQKWENGEISAANEHLASAIIARVLSSFYTYVDVPEPDKGKIVISSAPNEYHEIGAWMTANYFEINGWDVHYLGSNTPARDVISILKTFKPLVLAVSVTMAYNIDGVMDIINLIKDDQELQNIKIFLGGYIFCQYPDLSKLIKADYIAKSFTDALKETEKLLN